MADELSPEDAAMVDDAAWKHTLAMWEDLIVLAAFQMIHGPRPGYLRFRYLRFGVPETDPVPDDLDFSKPFPLPIFPRGIDS